MSLGSVFYNLHAAFLGNQYMKTRNFSSVCMHIYIYIHAGLYSNKQLDELLMNCIYIYIYTHTCIHTRIFLLVHILK